MMQRWMIPSLLAVLPIVGVACADLGDAALDVEGDEPAALADEPLAQAEGAVTTCPQPSYRYGTYSSPMTCTYAGHGGQQAGQWAHYWCPQRQPGYWELWVNRCP
jgi:hypothetical protein